MENVLLGVGGDDDHGDGQVIEVGNGDCEAGSDVILQATQLKQY